MTAFNAVRFRVKPGCENDFIAANRAALREGFPGMRKISLMKTGDHTFCIIGEWSGMRALSNARPKMIGVLDGVRHMLEDLGNGLGVTDPVSGEAVLERSFTKSKTKAAAPAQKKPAAKKTAKKTPKKPAAKRARRR